jgi:heme exporter protein A
VALNHVSLTVKRGDFAVLLGRNGAGKSTLLRVAAHLIRPSSGLVQIGGIPLERNPHQVRTQIGFVGHSTYLYRNLTARENLQFVARLYGLEQREERIDKALAWVGLEESADREVKGFSRGMQQRLALARATLHDPELLLMDEPFTGLDWEAAGLLADWMENFVASGKTILMVTHDLEQGLERVNRWLLLDRGRLMEELTGDCHTVREHYKQFLRIRSDELS